MAQKTAADKKKTPGSKPKTKPKNNIPPEPEPKAPVRRAVGGCVCLLLAIFTLLGYFTSDGIFIEWFSGFLRGIIGGGFYYVAPMLIIASLMLFFHHGKPVTGRLVCVLLLPAVVGMLYQLFDGTEYELSLKIIGSLWKDGREMVGGGAVSGFLSELFKTLFSRIGAAIFIILALILMVMFAVWD